MKEADVNLFASASHIMQIHAKSDDDIGIG